MSLYFKIRGVLSKIQEEKIINDSFKKRTFTIDDNTNPFNGSTKDTYYFDLIGNNTVLLDSFNVGDFVEVYFNIRCKEYKKEGVDDRCFVSLQAWRIIKHKVDNPDIMNNDLSGEQNSIEGENKNTKVKEEDDLPF